MDAASGESARLVRDHGLARLDVDHHRRDRVDERERIGTGILAGLHVGDDGRHVRGELDDERQGRRLADSRNDLVQHLRVLAKGVSARLHVRTRDVHLQGVDDTHQLRRHLGILLDRAAPDVGDHRHLHVLPVPGDRDIDEVLDARALEADRVDESAIDLGVTRHGIPGPRRDADPLRRHRAELRIVDRADVFRTIPERTARRRNRRRHLESTQIDLRINHGLTPKSDP